MKEAVENISRHNESLASQFRDQLGSNLSASYLRDYLADRQMILEAGRSSSLAALELTQQIEEWQGKSEALDLAGQMQGLRASEVNQIVSQLREGLDAVSRQAELAAFTPRYEELADMAANAKSAWAELLTSANASYALAAMATLREAIEQAPFSEEAIAALHSQLGDWQAESLSAKVFNQQARQEVYFLNGLDHRLVDLEPHTFDAMLGATDLEAPTISPDVDREIEPSKERHAAHEGQREPEESSVDERKSFEDDQERRDIKVYQRLRTFESHLRNFVAGVLSEAVGPDWLKQRVPGDCLKNWRERQEADEAKKRKHELLHYSDLADWSKIIRQKNNWIHFQRYFNRQTFVEEAFNRLIPIRNDIAHMRPLTQADRLIFYAEILQLSTAIEVPKAAEDIDLMPEDIS